MMFYEKAVMDLLYHFAPIVEEYYRHHDMKGQRRKILRYQERSDSSLFGSVNKLFFILSYMKENRDFYGLCKRWCINFFIFSVVSDASEYAMDDLVTHGV